MQGSQVLAARLRVGLSRKKMVAALAPTLVITERQLQNMEGGRPVSDVESAALEAFFATVDVDVSSIAVTGAPPRGDKTPETPVGRPQVRPVDLSRPLGTGTSLPLLPARRGTVRLVSNSEVQSFADCRRRWWLHWYRGLSMPRESPTGALAIGKRIHRALERYYLAADAERPDPRDVLERLITEDWTALVEAGMYTAELEAKFNQEANLERAMISGYMEWLAETGADADMRTVGAERYMEATLFRVDEGSVLRQGTDEVPAVTEVRLIGKIDLQVEMLSDGSRRVMDNKTAQDFQQLRARLTLGDPQMLTYHLLEWLNTEEGEKRCNGALFNMLRKVKRTGAAKPPFYERVTYNYNDEHLTNFRTRLEGQVADMLQVESDLLAGVDHRSVAWPRPSNDCRWKCEFNAVCPMFDDGSYAEQMLATVYVVKDPLEYYQLEGDTTE